MSGSSIPDSQSPTVITDWTQVNWDSLSVAAAQQLAELRLSQTGEFTLTSRGIFPKLSPWLSENGDLDVLQWDQRTAPAR